MRRGRSLTRLVGGDVDRSVAGRAGTLLGDPVDRLDLKGVPGVSQQVADMDVGVRQSQLTGDKLHVVPAAGAPTTPATAALADDVVDQVVPASTLLRGAPFQPQRRLVHHGDDAAGRRWDGWDRETETQRQLSPHRTVQRGHCGDTYWCRASAAGRCRCGRTRDGRRSWWPPRCWSCCSGDTADTPHPPEQP